MSKIDEILKLKNLLDSGLINQSDFDKIKKQIFDGSENPSIDASITAKSEIKENNQVANVDYPANTNSTKRCLQCGSDNSFENLECKICKTDFSTVNNLSKSFREIENDSNNSKYFIIGIIAVLLIVIGFVYYSNSNKSDNKLETNTLLNDSITPSINVTDSTSGTNQECADCPTSDTLNNLKSDTTNYENSYNSDNSVDNTNLVIGNYHQGGKIIYIFQPDDSDYVDGEVHGLIISTSAITTTASSINNSWGNLLSGEYGCYGTKIGNTSSSLGSGPENTNTIYSNCKNNQCGAYKCMRLTIGGYSDWFIPSKNEVAIIYQNYESVGGVYPTQSQGVWSSTEISSSNAWVCSFDGGGGWISLPKNYVFNIKPLRKF